MQMADILYAAFAEVQEMAESADALPTPLHPGCAPSSGIKATRQQGGQASDPPVQT
jgi:hypothetical protein